MTRRLALLTLLALAHDAAHAAGTAQLTVPIRWCALQGSAAAVNPACSGETSTKRVLFRRYTRTTASHYLTQCNVSLRSGATFAVPAFPVIPDPCDGSVTPSCKGVTGDIVLNAFEDIQMRQSCAAAWAAMGISDVGVVAVNIRRFTDPQGNPIGILGSTSDIGSIAGMEIGVIDNDFSLAVPNQPAGCVTPEPLVPDPTDQIFGHEFGHSHSLQHTDTSKGDPLTLMKALYPLVDFLTSGGQGQTDIVCPNPVPPLGTLTQCGRVRTYGLCNTNGLEVDPPPVIDSLPVSVGDASPPHVDLRKVGVISDSNLSRATFFWHTGLFTRQATGVQFVFALDLDLDAGTGGDPASLGLPLAVSGAELAGSVEVSAEVFPGQPAHLSATGRLWRFDQGGFVPAPALGMARETTMQILQVPPAILPDEIPYGAFIGLEFDRGLLESSPGVPSTAMAVRAGATDPAPIPPETGSDVTPRGELFLIVPQLPTCVVTPAEARAGTPVTVTAGGLSRNRTTRVMMGTDAVASGTTDGSGATRTQFMVPPAAAPGAQPILIEVDDPVDAVTADCVLTVLPEQIGAGDLAGDLTVAHAVGGSIQLAWPGSCAPGDTDYEVYEGSLMAFYSHQSRLCSTGGATSVALQPGGGNQYYLVVPANAVREGSYGLASDGGLRPAGSQACRPQELRACH